METPSPTSNHKPGQTHPLQHPIRSSPFLTQALLIGSGTPESLYENRFDIHRKLPQYSPACSSVSKPREAPTRSWQPPAQPRVCWGGEERQRKEGLSPNKPHQNRRGATRRGDLWQHGERTAEMYAGSPPCPVLPCPALPMALLETIVKKSFCHGAVCLPQHWSSPTRCLVYVTPKSHLR
ncbi:hypothetical protein O3P69_018960 [Scylla paramamosain]|uniref:Uncharacterized protein n=1 Tax=Scylla paramamosain TaxID=85552 RepID=A0AAW0SJS1_SCYPA